MGREMRFNKFQNLHEIFGDTFAFTTLAKSEALNLKYDKINP